MNIDEHTMCPISFLLKSIWRVPRFHSVAWPRTPRGCRSGCKALRVKRITSLSVSSSSTFSSRAARDVRDARSAMWWIGDGMENLMSNDYTDELLMYTVDYSSLLLWRWLNNQWIIQWIIQWHDVNSQIQSLLKMCEMCQGLIKPKLHGNPCTIGSVSIARTLRADADDHRKSAVSFNSKYFKVLDFMNSWYSCCFINYSGTFRNS